MNTTQVKDGASLAEWQAVRDSLRAALARVEAIKPGCHSCAHYDLGRCKQHDADIPVQYKKTPENCQQWQYDGIPF